jgi:hypothetical protein
MWEGIIAGLETERQREKIHREWGYSPFSDGNQMVTLTRTF